MSGNWENDTFFISSYKFNKDVSRKYQNSQALKTMGLYISHWCRSKPNNEYLEALLLHSRCSQCSHPKHHQTSCQDKHYPSFRNEKIEVHRNVVIFSRLTGNLMAESGIENNFVLQPQITLFSNKIVTYVQLMFIYFFKQDKDIEFIWDLYDKNDEYLLLL